MPKNLRPGEFKNDRIYFKNDKLNPALHISRSIGDTLAHSIGVLSDPGKLTYLNGGRRVYH